MNRLIASAILMTFVFAGAAYAGAKGICYDPGPSRPQTGYVCAPCGCSHDDKVASEAGSCAGCGMDLIARADIRNVAIVVHDGVELLDFSGPGEVFAASGGRFNVYTVSEDGKPIVSQGFLRVDPNYSIHDCPWPDILVVPGGGSSELLNSQWMMEWVRNVSREAEFVMSVCTGAYVLAEAGLLDGRSATTHWGEIESLKRVAPKATIHTGTRFVRSGNVLTTAGVSAGIDGALYLVAEIFGGEMATATAEYMEYDKWEPEAGLVIAGER